MKRVLAGVALIIIAIHISGSAQPCDTAAPDCAPLNLLNNGDFESGDLTGWESSGPGLSIRSDSAYQGAFAAHITGAVQAIQEWIPVEPGQTYVATAWFRWDAMTNNDWGFSQFSVIDDSFQEIARITELDTAYPAGVWHKLALPFVPAASQIRITFGIFGPETRVDFTFDDIMVFKKTGNLAPIIAPQADIQSGPAPLTVHFAAHADDQDGAIRLHRWQFGDGTESRDANPVHTYISGGSFTVTYTAYDVEGASASSTMTIAVSDFLAPAITVASPFSGDSFVTGDPIILLEGQASSPHADITTLVWDNIHAGDAASVNIQSGPAVHWQASFGLKPGLNEILLTATDSTGHVGTTRLWITREIAGPAIANITASSLSPRVYERYELTFDVETVADHPLFMYDPQPPPGAERYNGVTVEGIITTPSGTTVTHPAFYHAGAARQGSRYELTGASNWKLRYAPLEPGIHQVSLRVTDQSGTQTVDAGSFTAQPPQRQGFIQVAQADSRYFEFTNGDLYWPLGMTWGGTQGTSTDGIDLSSTVLNYDRLWMASTGAYSTNWARWVNLVEEYGNEGLGAHFRFDEHYPSSELSQYIHHQDGFRMWLTCWLDDQFCANVQAGATYQIKLRAKISNLNGPKHPDQPFGLTIRSHDWIGQEDPDTFFRSVQSRQRWIPYIQQDTDWHTLVATVTAQSGSDDFSIYLENVTSGEAFIDEFSVRQRLPDGSLGPELIRMPKADMHTYVEQRPMAFWDETIQAGEQNGIFLRLVVHDKNDRIQNHLDAATGLFVRRGGGYYQQENTKATWLQKQWWRYLVARLGYSTTVFSWELNNEGPPDDGTGSHARHAQIFGSWMHDLDAHPHLVSTSFWCCWEPEFWGDHQNFPDVDFADIHTYGVPADMVQWYLDDAQPAIDSQVGKPVVRGETGILAGEGQYHPHPALRQPNPGVWFHNMLWSQLHYSSMFEIGYWFPEHVTGFQREAHLRPFYQFVRDLDVHRGGYWDMDVASDQVQVRVLGQKNLQRDTAHAWVNHRDHTWRRVMEWGQPSAVSARITFQMNPDTRYAVVWYNTYSGESQPAEIVLSDSAGFITLEVDHLTNDVAFKLSAE